MRRLQSLQFAATQACASQRSSFILARGLSTTNAAQGKNTDWVRKKLWQGEAPGAADPYTQRVETAQSSNLPEEALDYQPREDRTPLAVRNSRIALPPKRTEAATEKELESMDPSYVPAESIEDLGEVSSLKSWWDQPGHWGEESEFKGFASTDKVVERDAIEVYLRRAFVEVLALQETGAFSEWGTKKWREGSRSDVDAALATELTVQNGNASLKGNAAAIADSLTSDVEDASVTRISNEEAGELIKTWDASWQEVALNDQVKFAVSVRSQQYVRNDWRLTNDSLASQTSLSAHGNSDSRRETRCRHQH